MFFIIEEAKEKVLEFSKGTVRVLWFYLGYTKTSDHPHSSPLTPLTPNQQKYTHPSHP